MHIQLIPRGLVTRLYSIPTTPSSPHRPPSHTHSHAYLPYVLTHAHIHMHSTATAAAVMWKIKFKGHLFHSGLPHKGINSIELGSEAIAYIQRRFYEDFPAVSMYVCVYACVISVRTPSRLVNNILQGYAIPVIPTSYLISILLSTLVRSATTFSHPPQ